jgi:quercetin dioxygenase-like cupin family protein
MQQALPDVIGRIFPRTRSGEGPFRPGEAFRVRMPATDFDAERTFDDEQFVAREVFRSDRTKVVCGFFEPGQFIPVHAPDSDVTVAVQSVTGLVREGDTDHRVEPGDVVAIEAGTKRGVKADDGAQLEALLVTAPPPTDAEHHPVRRGIREGEFEPDAGAASK